MYGIHPLTLSIVDSPEGPYESVREAESIRRFHCSFPWPQNFVETIDSSGELCLELFFSTQLEETAILEVSSEENAILGRLHHAGQSELLLVGEKTKESMREFSTTLLEEAKKIRRAELWPDRSVIELFRELRNTSTAQEMRSRVLQLTCCGGYPLTYKGETVRGTPIGIKSAHGYAVAEAVRNGDLELIHSEKLGEDFFRNTTERDRFAAKAFGELIALGEI